MANSSGVGDIGHIGTLSEVGASARRGPAQLAITRSARRAKRASAAAKACRVDAGMGGDVVNAVVDDQLGVADVEQQLSLGHVGPQNRVDESQARRCASHKPRQQQAH